MDVIVLEPQVYHCGSLCFIFFVGRVHFALEYAVFFFLQIFVSCMKFKADILRKMSLMQPIVRATHLSQLSQLLI
jgi:hypothetical protein